MKHAPSAMAWRAAARRTLLVVSFLGMSLAAHRLHGSDDTVRAENEPQTQQQNFQSIAFDQQMRGMLGNGVEEIDGVVERKAIAQLELEIARIDETCGLTEAQRASLALASRLEGARAAERFEKIKRRYAGRSVDLQTREGQQEWQRFHQDMMAVQQIAAHPGNSRHLLGRVVGGVLDDRQRAAWNEEAALRRASQWRRMVDTGMTAIESLAGLTTRQHEELVALLVEHPPQIDLTKARQMFGDQNPFVVWYALSLLDQDRFEGIFDVRQMEKVRTVIQQGEAWRQTFESLKMIGE